MKRCFLLTAAILLAAWGPAHGAGTAEKLDFFENRIRPLLSEHCLRCHGGGQEPAEGGLRLDSRAGWRAGGDSGPAIVPGDPRASRLVRAVRYDDTDLQMPPDGKLSQRQIADLVRWIEMGAPDPRDGQASGGRPKTFDLATRRAAHWAWQPIVRPRLPATQDRQWPRMPADCFIPGGLQSSGLAPAPPADRRVMIRRLTFDLIGLPPTPAEIDAFLADRSPLAYAHLVDRLLASPHFGQKWGQHWLDLVRYAETRGHEQDFPIPEAYRYRDYIIRAFNADVPYDQLVIEHVAGDLLASPRLAVDDRSNQSIQGTGFWHLGEATHSPVDIRGDEADRVHNQIDVFSRTFLGLSVGCARCHDHKFDAISTRDYYALFGYLQSSGFQLADVADPEAQRRVARALASLRERYAGRIFATWAACRLDLLGRPAVPVGAAGAGSAGAFERPAALTADNLSAPLVRAARLDQPNAGTGQQRIAAAAGLPPHPGGGPAAPRPLADYLIAACRKLRGVSWDHSLQAKPLQAIVAHLRGAAERPDDPLYPLALFASRNELPDSGGSLEPLRTEILARFDALEAKRTAALRGRTVVWSDKIDERHYARRERPWTAADVAEDFAFPADAVDRWLVSGQRFGRRPAGCGTVLLGANAQRPLAELLDRPAALADLRSPHLTGMLRTRTFEIVGDTLWYHYRGTADCFLAVDSHRVVHGPLHAVVRQKLKGKADRWSWHAHPVRDYLGHRVHVEFTPGPGFALDRVEFSAKQPPDTPPVNGRVRRWVDRFPAARERSAIAALARESSAMLAASVAACLRGRAEADDVRIVNWLIDHPQLFEPVLSVERAMARAWSEYRQQRTALEAEIPRPVRALALWDGSGEDEPVHIRGNHRNRSAQGVPRAILTALRSEAPRPIPRGSGRLELARQLVDPSNPLLARVMANRLWYHLFGRGIVATVDDFGVLGERPSHPRLLDYLALDLREHGWSLKRSIRRLVLTATYGMSSRPDDRAEALDPTNRLLHRMPIRRLSAEAIRDAMLAVSGRLDARMFGPSVPVHITPFMRGHRTPPGSGPLDGAGRRSIFVEVRRNHLSAMLRTFDKPIPFTTVGRRNVSNGPAQALVLLNDPFVHAEARRWAERLMRFAGTDEDARLRAAYRSALGRGPEPGELRAARDFLARQQRNYRQTRAAAAERQAWTDLCHTLLNVKEFVYVY